MSTSIRFLGAAGFEIAGPGLRVLIDPFLSQSPLAPVAHEDLQVPDLILVTHAAYDHLGDAAAIARRTGAPVACGGDVRQLLIDDGVPPEQIRPCIWGVVVRIGGVVVRPLECHHWSMSTRRNGQILSGTPLAFLIEIEPDCRIYHYGDTSYFDMGWIGELYRPTVGLIGCSQPYELDVGSTEPGELLSGELDPDEAARVAEMLGLDIAVACHYLTHNADLDAFVERVRVHDSSGRRETVVPALGETLVVEGGRVVSRDDGRPSADAAGAAPR